MLVPKNNAAATFVKLKGNSCWLSSNPVLTPRADAQKLSVQSGLKDLGKSSLKKYRPQHLEKYRLDRTGLKDGEIKAKPTKRIKAAGSLLDLVRK